MACFLSVLEASPSCKGSLAGLPTLYSTGQLPTVMVKPSFCSHTVTLSLAETSVAFWTGAHHVFEKKNSHQLIIILEEFKKGKIFRGDFLNRNLRLRKCLYEDLLANGEGGTLRSDCFFEFSYLSSIYMYMAYLTKKNLIWR